MLHQTTATRGCCCSPELLPQAVAAASGCHQKLLLLLENRAVARLLLQPRTVTRPLLHPETATKQSLLLLHGTAIVPRNCYKTESAAAARDCYQRLLPLQPQIPLEVVLMLHSLLLEHCAVQPGLSPETVAAQKDCNQRLLLRPGTLVFCCSRRLPPEAAASGNKAVARLLDTKPLVTASRDCYEGLLVQPVTAVLLRNC